MEPDSLNSFFEVFGMRKIITPSGDLGLDPVIVRRIITLFGGSVHVDNRSPSGVCLKATLAG